MISTWERFRDKFIIDENGCWIAKVKDDGGYGQFWYEGKTRRGHSVVIEIMSGCRLKRGDDLEPDHLCKNRACWNPFHLEAVDHPLNTLRGDHFNKMLTKCKNGHPFDEENTYYYKGRRQCKECNWRSGRRAKRNQQKLQSM